MRRFLVEKELQLGGYLHKVYNTVDGIDIPTITQ